MRAVEPSMWPLPWFPFSTPTGYSCAFLPWKSESRLSLFFFFIAELFDGKRLLFPHMSRESHYRSCSGEL